LYDYWALLPSWLQVGCCSIAFSVANLMLMANMAVVERFQQIWVCFDQHWILRCDGAHQKLRQQVPPCVDLPMV